MDYFLKDNQDIYKSDDIIYLTKNDFKIKKNKVIITNKLFNNKNGYLIIYSPFCEVCKKHAEIWEEYANILKNRFIISVIDAYGPDGDITSYLNVKGYPTIKFIKLNGSLEDVPIMSMEDYFNKMLYYSGKPI